ncbi:hypothetical protein GMRT_11116 [Giardia muris]|uniref:Uncharacterized protein n=1 Tax=Giardia muris TaxID=5742 RepID=A0A4Z1T8V1_GIAMU|nr:hypothetical protein GMRT_11116 [Giardia muris]|eukprot:TNJ28941.1 hypothetical protein GMRT_11116 [Giardia muris]
MICSVCSVPFSFADYCPQDACKAVLETSTTAIPSDVPTLDSIQYICTACYFTLHKALSESLDGLEAEVTILRKQDTERIHPKSMATSQRTLTEIQAERAAIDAEIESLVAQLLPSEESSKDEQCTWCTSQDFRPLPNRPSTALPFFDFDESTAQINGFSLLLTTSTRGQTGKEATGMMAADSAHTYHNNSSNSSSTKSIKLSEQLTGFDSINAALAELSLCAYIMYQISLGGALQCATSRLSYSTRIYSEEAKVSDDTGEGDTDLTPKPAHFSITIRSWLFPALPAPIAFYWPDGVTPDVLSTREKLDMKGLKCLCSLLVEKAGPAKKLWSSVRHKDNFSMGLAILTAYVLELYMLCGLRAPCAASVDVKLLNAFNNSTSIDYYYAHLPDAFAILKTKPFPSTPAQCAELNITITKDDRAPVTLDTLPPVHPNANSDGWNGFAFKLIVLVKPIYSHLWTRIVSLQ